MKNPFIGRIGRKEFWIAYIPLFLILFAFLLIAFDISNEALAVAAVVIFGLAQTILIVWRLHDTNHGGFNILIAAIPFGGLYLLYLFFKKSDEDTNAYGEKDSRQKVVYSSVAKFCIYAAYIFGVPVFAGAIFTAFF